MIMHPIQQRGQTIKQYDAPTTIESALKLLADYGKRARVIAGGTDLIVELDRNQRQGVDTLIDLTRIPELNQIEQLANGAIRIGATVTHNQIVASDLLRERGVPLVQACWEVGSPQLRNRATVVGNVVTASPANDTISALWAMDAQLTLRSLTGVREIPLRQFYKGVRQTFLAENELVTHITLPARAGKGIYVKLGNRRAQAISVVHLAIWLEEEPAHQTHTTNTVAFPRVKHVDIALGSVAPTIVSAAAAEQFLQGQPLNVDVIAEAARLVGVGVKPISDVRGSADYRTDLLPIMTKRALTALRDGHAVLPTDPAFLQAATNGLFPTGNGLESSHSQDDMIHTTINGNPISAPLGTHQTLVDWLREAVGLTGTKLGCAEGECGSCTVFLDGMAVMGCLVPAARAHHADIMTVEGLPDQSGELHPIQQAFIDTGAVQCGYCIPGFLMSGAKLLEEKPNPSHEQILQAYSGNLCRCTGYYKIIEAVHAASDVLAANSPS